MTLRIWLKLAAVAIALVAVVCIYFAWQGAQRDQAQLKAELQATRKAVADADARQQSRNSDLARHLAQLNQEKTSVRSPVQVVQALPDVLPLPTPLTLPAQTTGSASQSATQPPGASKSQTPGPSAKVQLPAEDLKPLYDFAVTCKECQVQLASVQANLKDEQAKTQAIGRERDTALRAARGGSVIHRIVRAAKWFAIGAAAGAVAAKLAH